MINFLNLHYFIVVAEELNFSKAARRLFISQQSLSNHIKKLEEEYGVLLFKREPQVSLTEAGESLYRNAKQLVSLQKKTERELLDIKDFRQGEIALGIPPSRGNVMLPPIIREYHRKFPQIKITVYEGDSSQLIKNLLEGKIDLSIGFDPKHEAIETSFLYKDHQYFVVPKNILEEYFTPEQQKRLLSSEKVLIEDFSSCPFVMANIGSWTGQLFTELIKTFPFEPNIVVTTHSTNTMLEICKAGIGVSICSESFLKDIIKTKNAPGNKVFCFAPENHLAEHNIVVSLKKGVYHSRAVNEFIEIVKSIYGTKS